MYGVRRHRARRRRVLLGAVLGLLLVATAFAGTGHPPGGKTHLGGEEGRTSLSPVNWPAQGQAALAMGNGRPAASPDERAVPIASLAKLMTAYLTLKRYPLSGAQIGFTITITPTQAQDEADEADQDESVVAVQAGEQLTERQLLEALLIPSSNNVARMLQPWSRAARRASLPR